MAQAALTAAAGAVAALTLVGPPHQATPNSSPNPNPYSSTPTPRPKLRQCHSSPKVSPPFLAHNGVNNITVYRESGYYTNTRSPYPAAGPRQRRAQRKQLANGATGASGLVLGGAAASAEVQREVRLRERRGGRGGQWVEREGGVRGRDGKREIAQREEAHEPYEASGSSWMPSGRRCRRRATRARQRARADCRAHAGHII